MDQLDNASSNLQSTPNNFIDDENKNRREFATQTLPSQSAPNKRFKQFVPIGIARITSPTKSPSKSPKKKTPQKNTLDNYFNLSPSLKKNSSQLENFNDLENPQPSVSGNSYDQLPKTPEKHFFYVDIQSDDDIDNCELPDTPEKFKAMKNGYNCERLSQITHDNDISNCVLPKTPEKLNTMKNGHKNDILLKTPEKFTPSDIPSDDDIDFCELPDTPEKYDQVRNRCNIETLPTTPEKLANFDIPSDDDIDYCELPSTSEKFTPSDIPSDDDIDFCELPDTPEKYDQVRNRTTPEKLTDFDIPSDDDIDYCELPSTSEKYNEMMRQVRERELSQPIASTSSNGQLNHDFNVLNLRSSHTLSLWNTLPEEIFEKIFSHLSIRKLCTDVNRVCKHWNEIISKPNYIPWKKKYFQFKSGDQQVKEEICNICKIENMAENTLCLIGLMRYMKCFISLSLSRRILPAIKKHSKYEWAIALLSEKVADCITNEEPCVGSIITALCVVSSHVKEILEILNILTHYKTDCSVIFASECLYCIATFFNYFRKNLSINPGFHYRVYYALYYFESGVSGLVQQPIGNDGCALPEIKPTPEQLQVINHPLGPNQIIKIVAFAGTGKTSTIAEFAKMWPNKRILNVCYNKSVCYSARKKFPAHVTCTTIHSLAFSVTGKQYKVRKRIVSNLYPRSFICLLEGKNRKERATDALKTINNFVNSANDFITITHVPQGKKKGNKTIPFSMENKFVIRDDATIIWNAMVEFKTHISHDVYLKLYQLSHPTLDFDCILIDEAQDLNRAMADILLRQKCSKVLVGDPHQQIYSYRGALNTLNSVQATHTYHLTQSFRFGPEIGYIASCALETMKKEEKTIVGTLREGKTNGERGGQCAIIARTKFELFAEAAKFCDENSGRSAAFLGGLENYGFSIITDLYKLYKKVPGTRVYFKNKSLARFDSFQQLVEETEANEDNELLGKILIVEQYKDRIPELFENIQRMCNYQQESADVIFSTTHKAKGQEFDTVVLSNDFISKRVQNENMELKYLITNHEESNILYVALTRAKHCLVMSDHLIEMLLASGERFEKIVYIKDDEGRSRQEENVCCNCGRLFTTSDKSFVLERLNINLSSSNTINGGILCYDCSISTNLNISNFSMNWAQSPSANDNVRPSLKFLLEPSIEETSDDN